MDYSVGCDIELVQELLGMSRGALADASGLSLPTLNRWVNDASRANAQNVEAFYAFAYGKGVRLNAIKAQLYREDYFADDVNVLFLDRNRVLKGLFPCSVQGRTTILAKASIAVRALSSRRCSCRDLPNRRFMLLLSLEILSRQRSLRSIVTG